MPGTLSVPTILNTLGQGNQSLSLIDADFASIVNYVNAREILFDVIGARPAFGIAGRYFFATDSLILYVDTGSAWQQLSPAVTSTAVGGYTVRGLVGTPNTNTTYDLTSAHLVQLRSPADGTTAVRTNVGALTCDLGAAGPIINGRDQAGAFAVSSWVYLYYIWDGSTEACVSSAVPPPTGPTLPAGYTMWALATALRFDGASHLIATDTLGSRAAYRAKQSALSDGRATVEATVDLSALVPPIASAALLQLKAYWSVATYAPKIRRLSTIDWFDCTVGNSTPAATPVQLLLPIVAQKFFYIWAADPGATAGLYADVEGYTIPNGDA